jgi:hypothetical protein
MIHAREDYNRIQDPANKIAENEPVFLIRAKDRVSAHTVRAWAEFHLLIGGDPALAQKAYEQAAKMEQWQFENGVKIADL